MDRLQGRNEIPEMYKNFCLHVLLLTFKGKGFLKEIVESEKMKR